jgi:hypothetical protein
MTWGKTISMLITGIALAATAGGVNAAAKLELLGQPCRAKNILATCIVKDRATGREMFVLSDMNESSNAELLFIDFEKNTGKSYRAPAGSGSWAVKEVPGDRLVVGTFYDGVFMVFDLKKMEFTKVIPFPGESYIWNLAMGSDGRVYGGTYAGAKLGALDLNNYTVEDLGAPAPPNLYLRNVWELPDGRVLCFFNTEKPTALIFDPKTKKFGPAPPAISNGVLGAVWNGYFVTGRQVFDGKTLEEVKPIPFPTPPEDKGMWSFASMITRDTVYMMQGQALYSYKVGDNDLKLISDLDTYRGSIRQVSSKGWALGLRGQDYFVIKPGDTKVELQRIPVESGPRKTLFLRVGPDGKLWGGPTFGQTLWWMDPATKKYVNTSNICDSGGEVYDVAFANGKVYAVAYAGGEIVEYDPAQPWDQVNLKNPRVIKRVGPDYIRPEGGTSLGPDGKLYTGWLAKYGIYGGAISITDPKTGSTELIENPLGEQAVERAIAGDGFVYVGSNLSANGLPSKKGEWARFGMVDLATKKVVFQHEFDGCYGVSVLGYDAVSKRVAISVGGKLTLFDAAKREFVDLPEMPKETGRCSALPGNGILCYASDKSVVRLDMRTGKTATVVEAPEKVENVACGPDGKLYLSTGVDVYAVKL